MFHNPADLVNSIDKLSDSDFFTFTLKLDSFPESSKILKMKESLKNVEKKSKRNRKTIRKIKQRKAITT